MIPNVNGDPVLLERLSQNLVDNVIRYNLPEHGWITVSADVVDRWVQLTVENTGPPVPPYAIPSLSNLSPAAHRGTTRRFNNLDWPGARLGLSIVRSVARAHGGDAHPHPGKTGGHTVVVHIPAAAEKPKPSSAQKSK